MSENKNKKAIGLAIAAMKKKYKGSLIQLCNESEPIPNVDSISTGSLLLDDAIGIGGLPCGRVVELYGHESSGKTTLATTTCVQAQQLYPDKYVGIIDVEHGFSKEYAKDLGLNYDTVLFSQPDLGEEAIDTVIELAESGACSVIVLDSIAALQTQRQLEKGIDEETMGEVARLLSKSLKKIVSAANRTGTLVILINQIREKIGVYGGGVTTPGGKAAKFYSSVRLEVKKINVITHGDQAIGQEIRVKVVKNKVGIPFGIVDLPLYFYRGFDVFAEIVDLALKKGAITKTGSWYTPLLDGGVEASDRVQGSAKVIEYYKNNPLDYEYLKNIIMEKSNG